MAGRPARWRAASPSCGRAACVCPPPRPSVCLSPCTFFDSTSSVVFRFCDSVVCPTSSRWPPRKVQELQSSVRPALTNTKHHRPPCDARDNPPPPRSPPATFARLTPARATAHSTLRAKSALRSSGAGRACALPSADRELTSACACGYRCRRCSPRLARTRRTCSARCAQSRAARHCPARNCLRSSALGLWSCAQLTQLVCCQRRAWTRTKSSPSRPRRSMAWCVCTLRAQRLCATPRRTPWGEETCLCPPTRRRLSAAHRALAPARRPPRCPVLGVPDCAVAVARRSSPARRPTPAACPTTAPSLCRTPAWT